MGPRRSGHSLYKQPGVNHISAMAQSEGGHHSSSKKTQTKSNDDRVTHYLQKQQNLFMTIYK